MISNKKFAKVQQKVQKKKCVTDRQIWHACKECTMLNNSVTLPSPTETDTSLN